jgi:hypothetical protein
VDDFLLPPGMANWEDLVLDPTSVGCGTRIWLKVFCGGISAACKKDVVTLSRRVWLASAEKRCGSVPGNRLK